MSPNKKAALSRILRRCGLNEEEAKAFFYENGGFDNLVFPVITPDLEEIRFIAYCLFLGIDFPLGGEGKQVGWQCSPISCLLLAATKAGVSAGNEVASLPQRLDVTIAVDSVSEDIFQAIVKGECLEDAVGEAFRSHFSEEGCSWTKAAVEATKAFWRTAGPLPEL